MSLQHWIESEQPTYTRVTYRSLAVDVALSSMFVWLAIGTIVHVVAGRGERGKLKPAKCVREGKQVVIARAH